MLMRHQLGRMEHIMDEKTSSAPMQEDPQKGEELSFTITGEDAEAQDALNAKKPEPQQKKKSSLPWILGAASVQRTISPTARRSAATSGACS